MKKPLSCRLDSEAVIRSPAKLAGSDTDAATRRPQAREKFRLRAVYPCVAHSSASWNQPMMSWVVTFSSASPRAS